MSLEGNKAVARRFFEEVKVPGAASPSWPWWPRAAIQASDTASSRPRSTAISSRCSGVHQKYTMSPSSLTPR